MLEIKSVAVGALQVNCYIIKDYQSGDIAVIDPGDSVTLLKELIFSNADKIKYILLTHGHFDHIGFARELKDKTSAKVVIGKDDKSLLSDNQLNLSIPFLGVTIPQVNADLTLNDGDKLKLGNTDITFISTPGHTKGSGCYIIDNNIFTGDTLMKLSMGRTDFPTGSDKEMMNSLKRLSQFEGEYNIYPGHGSFSSLSYEKKCNPYIRSVI